MSNQRSISCGLDFCAVPDLNNCIFTANSSKYEFVFVPLIHPLYKREFVSGAAKSRNGPFTRPDLVLCSSDWNNLIIGKLSSHIKVDSRNFFIKKNSEEALNQEFALARHLGLVGVTFRLMGGIEQNGNLARIVSDKVTSTCTLQVWIQIPMENPVKQAYSYREQECSSVESTWEWWNAFRIICDYDRKVGIALIVSHDLPEQEEIDRWLGEPVRCLIFPTTIFITNKKGYPVLSKAHQTLVKRFSMLEVQFVLTGANRHQNIGYYHNYLEYLWKGCQINGPVERFARGYEDYLQCPLQPLMDNLESQTYEIFEKDPVKYTQYQTAIYQAILGIASKTEEDKNRKIVIMVVGAGRGPLVYASLNAAEMARQNIKVYAVEKNPNAVLTLQALERDVWGEKVTVVSCDMREWDAPEKADILVSELLGSFSDNELSPECLDGVQKFLKDDGISIPSSYTSYIAPVQSSKLYNEVRQCKDKEKHSLAHFETSYVVHLQNKYDIAKPQPLFTFKHPNKGIVIDNSRYEIKTFEVQQNCVLHGFSGYFDTVLYKDVTLSIEPSTHSPGMFSWFPIFFPIREPVQLKAGDEIVVHFWRQCSTKNVWYEWCISKPIPVAIHNPGGRSYTIGL
ncbi:PREDICTED: protein arginine N-methyltransferase 5 [Dufourea novaeangliae]|uniref:Protein arginine N-methyltransferase n=1 Tax=Dufourea novaeangliae TaxID=178035 RepID=A0A154P963_DUFNO|nr:PREDICTED: protein arginine N-methyltransferase 5 [Dufourea novaeangliae]KZC08382.1 Protein arginine N-methyltransferase 5 [Dufourea novaeangliae]